MIFSLQRSIHCRVARFRPLLKIRIHLLHLQVIKSKKKASEIDRACKLLILATNSPFNCWFHAFSQFRILKEKKLNSECPQFWRKRRHFNGDNDTSSDLLFIIIIFTEENSNLLFHVHLHLREKYNNLMSTVMNRHFFLYNVCHFLERQLFIPD